jgi:hypothetical protein
MILELDHEMLLDYCRKDLEASDRFNRVLDEVGIFPEVNMDYSIKELFSLVDGRLSTDMDDIYAMLNDATGHSLLTHQLPVALKFIQKLNPKWFMDASDVINGIKDAHGNDFKTLMKVIDADYSGVSFEITEIPEDKYKEFSEYMVENSLLRKLGDKD